MGVKVNVLNAQHLTITIRGATTNELKGQPRRRLTIAAEGSAWQANCGSWRLPRVVRSW